METHLWSGPLGDPSSPWRCVVLPPAVWRPSWFACQPGSTALSAPKPIQSLGMSMSSPLPGRMSGPKMFRIVCLFICFLMFKKNLSGASWFIPVIPTPRTEGHCESVADLGYNVRYGPCLENKNKCLLWQQIYWKEEPRQRNKRQHLQCRVPKMGRVFC